MSCIQHHFNVEIAQKFGINVAIFLDHMVFWITKNIANNKNIHDGAVWTYNSVAAYTHIFSYLSTKQIRKVLSDCEKFDLIKISNYNENKYDRTQWYCLTENASKLLNISILPKGQMDYDKKANGLVQKGEPIPDTISVTKQEREESSKAGGSKNRPAVKATRVSRSPLSEDFQPDQERQEKAKAVSQRCNVPTSDLLSKFISMCKSNFKKSSDWQSEYELFLLREKPQGLKTTKESKPKQEIRSTVKEFEKDELPIKRASITTVSKHMDGIKQLLKGKLVNGSVNQGRNGMD